MPIHSDETGPNLDRRGLTRWLQHSGAPADAWTVFGPPRDETLCIEEVGGQFLVFYWERGLRSGLETYACEAAACARFAERLASWFPALRASDAGPP